MPAAYKKLTGDELVALAGEELPQGALDSLLRANVAAPVNLAAALRRALRRDGREERTDPKR
jgi:hypothetical protein